MKRDLAYAMEDKSRISTPFFPANDVQDLESDVTDTQVNHTRPVVVKVYTRNKRFKSDSKILVSGDSKPLSGDTDLSDGKIVDKAEAEGSSGMEAISVEKSRVFDVEVKQETASVGLMSNGTPRRFTRSALSGTADNPDMMTDGDLEGLTDVAIVEVGVLEEETVSDLETLDVEISKKLQISERPVTVKEVLDTGLLEGYPVFYNGGKKGIPLRGTIKGDGILCSCNSCQGQKVIPPCKFEIHACKTYRRASQYICLENGKSLLDVVKECRNGSIKKLEGTIQRFIGPRPVKESVVCQNCKSLFLATSVGKVDQLCDSCIIAVKSKNCLMHTPYVKNRALEPVMKVQSPERAEVKISSTSKLGEKRKIKFSVRASKQSASQEQSGSSTVGKKKIKLKLKKKLPKLISALKSSECASVSEISKSGSQPNILKSSPPKSLKIASVSVSPQPKNAWKITKKDQRMHWLVFNDGGLPDGTELAYFSRGQKLLEGYKSGSGIFCSCCNNEVSPSLFEAHAGWASRRKPYGYIYMSNGVSLHEFALSLLKGRKCTANDNDDLCFICADGGKLVLCDGCPRAFHKECASLSSIPHGKWYCKYCKNMFQRERFVELNENALAAGRVPGIDAIEQIASRCIRTVTKPVEADVISCVICRGYDFSKSGFGPRTVILCDQCEREYHVGCLKKQKMADLKELPKGKWFCGDDCKRIFGALNSLLNSGPEKLPASCLGVITKNLEAKDPDAAVGDFDVRWRLLSGKITNRETRVLLSEAVAIFHDCFDPIVDVESGRDFIPCLVYGRNIRGQDFGGMYCAILTINSLVVSAGIFRIFGHDKAELPLVATRKGYQGKGCFQLLFSCIEKLLAYLRVKTLVLPAAEEAESIWIKKFGFTKIPSDQLVGIRKTCWQMINFKGTAMLEKTVPKCRILGQDIADSEDPAVY